MRLEYRKSQILPWLLLASFAAFLIFASGYNLSTLFHWSGKFWGWESAGVYYIKKNFPGAVLYEDALLVYPFSGTILIQSLSQLLSISLLRAEILLVYVSGLSIGWSVYWTSIIFGQKDTAFALAAVGIMLGINVVNPIVYNSVSLALSTYAIYSVLRRRVLVAGLCVGLALTFKQNYGIGMLVGLALWALADIVLFKNRFADLFKIIGAAVAFALLLIALAHGLGFISLEGFVERVFIGAGEQKGGIQSLFINSYLTIIRVFDFYLALSILAILAIWALDRKYTKLPRIADAITKNLLPIFCIIFVLSIVAPMSNSMELKGVFQRVDFRVVRQIFTVVIEIFKVASLVLAVTFGLKIFFPRFNGSGDLPDQNYSRERQSDFIGLTVLAVTFSIFIHMSSKVSDLVSYPSFLIVLGYLVIGDFIRADYRKTYGRCLYILAFFIFWNTFVAEKNGVSLASSEFSTITSNEYARGVKFPIHASDESLYSMLRNNLAEDSSIQILPDNLPVSSLYNNKSVASSHEACSVVNKFVDMFPDDRIFDEVQCFLSNMPDFVLLVDPAYTQAWADKYVRKNSSGMQFVNLLIPVVKSNYSSVSVVEVDGLTYELFKRR